MTRTKAADEAFCRACGVAIKKQAPTCPHCGSPTASFPGFTSGAASGSSSGSYSSSSGDLIDSESLRQVSPYIGWAGGMLLILAGLGTVFSFEGFILTSMMGGFIIVAAGAFALPPVRRELRPTMVEYGLEPPLSPGVVAAISLITFFVGSAIAGI